MSYIFRRPFDYAQQRAIVRSRLIYSKTQILAPIEQEGFRFRNDDGSESTATWRANQDINVSLATAGAVRLRYLINASGDPDSKQFQLEYRHRPSGGSFGNWGKVN